MGIAKVASFSKIAKFFPIFVNLIHSLMRKCFYAVVALVALAACGTNVKPATGYSEPDLGWLFLEKGPYTLSTKVKAAPGPATFQLVTDLSLMAETPDVILETSCTVAEDSTISVSLGNLNPGFYEVRLRDSVRFNIGIRPEDVVSAPDAPKDFDAFWKETLSELDNIPLEPVYKEIPEYSNDLRTCYEVSFASFGGATAGGVISIPNAPGKYPVLIQYMGYGAEPFYYDPSANPGRIDFLVSVREQGIFKDPAQRWIDKGLSSKEEFYYRGAFAEDSVPEEDLITIARAGIEAPSGCNKQTTDVVIVNDQEILDKIKAQLDPPVAQTAPAMIVVTTRRINAYRDRCFAVQDYSAAIENMLLAIVELGYQSCWYEGHITDEDRICDRIAQILGIPDEFDVVCILPVGKAADDFHAPSKKPLSERVRFNRWI